MPNPFFWGIWTTAGLALAIINIGALPTNTWAGHPAANVLSILYLIGNSILSGCMAEYWFDKVRR